MRRYSFYLLSFLAAVVLITARPSFANVQKTEKLTAHAALPAKPAPDIKNSPSLAGEKALPETDTDETTPLPAYPEGARVAIGKMQTYIITEEDTLLDVARYFHLGYVEIRAANPEVDPWTPVPDETVTIPSFKLLPRAPQKGIVVNLAQMRLYYFRDQKNPPLTFPIGVGREGLNTPTGETTLVRKVIGPIWYPTKRMREEKPELPVAFPAGPSNPLGTHALYLGWPEFRIHGTDKPWAIGRRVSSGCMRMYPEDIITLFKIVPVGTKVTVVDQPILAGWIGNDFYLEANPSRNQSNDIETSGDHIVKELDDGLKKVIAAAGEKADLIDWEIVKTVVAERLGYPVKISMEKAPEKKAAAEPEKQPSRVEYKYKYN